MIRAATLLIVLTLTGTPTATSLCITWCGAQTSPGAEGASCHHQTMATSGTPSLVAKEHSCDVLLQSVPFVREDLQRVAAGSAPGHAVVVIAHRLGWEAAGRLLTLAWEQPPSLRLSDSTALRL